jgi:hypothetical protein
VKGSELYVQVMFGYLAVSASKGIVICVAEESSVFFSVLLHETNADFQSVCV